MRFRGVLTVWALALALSPIFLVAEPVKAASASYFFTPSNIKLNVGQSATVTLYLSTDTAINAGDGTVVLPSAYVSGSSISKSGSVFANWPEEPGVNGASIRFAGGLPTPGYQGTSGKILSFSVKGTSEGTGLITISGGRILANNANSTNIFSGASTATVTVTRVVSGAAISSTTHPDPAKWYKAKDASLTWTKPSGATSYSYTLSHDGGQPSKTGSGAATSANFTGLADGVWTFSLVTNYSDGKTANSSYTIRVDTTPPVAFSFKSELKNGSTDPFPLLTYQTTDTPSGIDHYEIIIDNNEPIITNETSYKLPKQKPGNHKLIVRAVDKAGNTTDATGSFTIEGFAGPTITDYPSISSIFQPIRLKGTALFGTKLQIYIDGNLISDVPVKEHLSEKQRRKADNASSTDDTVVEWEIELKNGLLPGKHIIYATQTKPDGAESNRSNEVATRVLADSVQLFSSTIPMLVVVLLLFFFLILLILLAIWLWRRVRYFIAGWRRKEKDIEEVIADEMRGLRHDLEKKIGPKTADPDEIIDDEVEQTEEDIDKDIRRLLGGKKTKDDE